MSWMQGGLPAFAPATPIFPSQGSLVFPSPDTSVPVLRLLPLPSFHSALEAQLSCLPGRRALLTVLPTLTSSACATPTTTAGWAGAPLGFHDAGLSRCKAVVTLGCHSLNAVFPLTSHYAPSLGAHAGQIPCLIQGPGTNGMVGNLCWDSHLVTRSG